MLYWFLFLIIVVFIVVVIMRHMSMRSHQESKAVPKMMYMDREHMNRIVHESFFFTRMSKLDCAARDINNAQSYMKLYVDSLTEFSEEEKKDLTDTVQKANVLLEGTKNIYGIHWRFAKISENIEQGWPHTIGDTIVLSRQFFGASKEQKVETLIHEKLHVYQRRFPVETELLITDYWGFKVDSKLENFPLARNNPDINSFVYAKDGHDILQEYTSLEPKSIRESTAIMIDERTGKKNDSRNNDIGIPNNISQLEHPYEIMGTYISIILHRDPPKDGSEFDRATRLWIQKYL